MKEQIIYPNIDVEEINDFDGKKLIHECHYGVKFHTVDGKGIKILLEYSDQYIHDDLVFYEDGKEAYRIKFKHALAISEFATALNYVSSEKDGDETNEYAWRSSL